MAKQKRPFTLLLSSRSDDRIDPVILPQEDEGGGHSATDNSSITNWEQEEQGQDFSTERLREQRQLTKRRVPIVGDPQQRVKEKERSVTSILKELAAIQQQGPQKYCMLGTRHCSYLHQQIIELLYVLYYASTRRRLDMLYHNTQHLVDLIICSRCSCLFYLVCSAYALVLSGNHVYTSGAGGTHAATIRGALRAERPDLLTVVLPQSLSKQPTESQELLHKVREVVAMPHNDELSLDVASRICNSYLLSQTDQLIAFAFHESTTVIEATKEAKTLHMLVTVLYLD
jgi:hypothetical protein